MTDVPEQRAIAALRIALASMEDGAPLESNWSILERGLGRKFARRRKHIEERILGRADMRVLKHEMKIADQSRQVEMLLSVYSFTQGVAKQIVTGKSLNHGIVREGDALYAAMTTEQKNERMRVYAYTQSGTRSIPIDARQHLYVHTKENAH